MVSCLSSPATRGSRSRGIAILCFSVVQLCAAVFTGALASTAESHHALSARQTTSSQCQLPSATVLANQRFRFVGGKCQPSAVLAVGQSCDVECIDGWATQPGAPDVAEYQCAKGKGAGNAKLLAPQFFFRCQPAGCNSSTRPAQKGWQCGSATRSSSQGIIAHGTQCTFTCGPNTIPSDNVTTCQFGKWVGGNKAVCTPIPGCLASQRNGWSCNRVADARGRLSQGTVCTLGCAAGQFGKATSTCSASGAWVGDTSPKCQACPRIANGQGNIVCTSRDTSKASTGFTCNAGFYLKTGRADQCLACTAVANSVGPVTCSRASDSQVQGCASGFFLTNSVSPKADTCTACTSVANSVGAVTCSSASDSQVQGCRAGFYLTNNVSPRADTCTACTPVANSTGAVTCSSATDSQVQGCAPGFFLTNNVSPQADTCTACTPVTNSVGAVTCSSATDSQVQGCAPGTFLTNNVSPQADTCTVCTPVANSTGPVTCSSATDSQVQGCAPGFFLTNNVSPQADTCTACTPVANGAGQITCTSATDSQVPGCVSGALFTDNAPPLADVCLLCTIANGTGPVTCTTANDGQAQAGFTCNNGTYFVNNTAPTADTCTSCTPIVNGTGAITCTGPSDSAAGNGFTCRSTSYLVTGPPDTCPLQCTGSASDFAGTGGAAINLGGFNYNPFPGGYRPCKGFRSKRTTDFNGCKSDCTDDSFCYAFTWSQSKGECALYSGQAVNSYAVVRDPSITNIYRCPTNNSPPSAYSCVTYDQCSSL